MKRIYIYIYAIYSNLWGQSQVLRDFWDTCMYLQGILLQSAGTANKKSIRMLKNTYWINLHTSEIIPSNDRKMETFPRKIKELNMLLCIFGHNGIIVIT